MNDRQKEKLLIEYREIIDKIARLEGFLSSDTIKEKSSSELLEKQLNVMMEYSFILQERLFILLKGE